MPDSAKPWLTCERCGSQFAAEGLTEVISFPEDVESILALYTYRLNVLTCKVCGHDVPCLVPLVCVDATQHRGIIVAPVAAQAALRAQLPATEVPMEATFVSRYDELLQALSPWVNAIVVPAGSLVIGDHDAFMRLDRAAQIERLPPLFLRFLKAQSDGRLTFIQITGGSTPDARTEMFRELTLDLIANHCERILLEACRTRTLEKLAELIDERVPPGCIDTEVLARVAQKCKLVSESSAAPQDFMVGFRNELLHAVLARHAGLENPRSRPWADYLRTIWVLSGRKDVVLDPQFMLPAALVKDITRYEDLWDASIADNLGGMGLSQSALDNITDMLTHWGFEERTQQMLQGGILRISVDGAGPEAQDKLGRLRDALAEALLKRIRFNESAEASQYAGQLIGPMIRNLLTSRQTPQAIELARDLLDHAKEAGDKVAYVAIAAYCSEPLNAFLEHEAAAGLIADAIDYNGGAQDLQPDLSLRFMVEIGNCARYGRRFEDALAMYRGAQGILRFTTDGAARERNADALEHNIAIVLRELRRFGESLAILQTLATRRPDFSEVQHTLSILHMLVGNPQAALQHLDQIMAQRSGGPRAHDESNLRISRAHLLQSLGRDADALQESAAVMAMPVASTNQLRAACIAIQCKTASEDEIAVRSRALEVVTDYLQSADAREPSDRAVTAAVLMAESMLLAGDFDSATEVAERFAQWHEDRVGLPWRVTSLECWLAYLRGDYPLAWQTLLTALGDVDSDVPHADGGRFAAGWLRDKGELQTRAAQVALRCVREGIVAPREFLQIYEFINGRELSARLDRGQRAERPNLANVSVSAAMPVECFLFLDAGEEVALLRMGHDAVVELLEAPALKTAEVARVRQATLSALKHANPSDLAALDRRMEPWRMLSARIGAAIQPHVSENVHVCFLPGRLLTGLPLHLLVMPDGRSLLEWTSVSYAANLATLLASRRERGNALAGLVVMPKQKESASFVENAQEIQQRLEATLQERFASVENIQGPLQGKSEVLDVLGRADEVVLLCHGYDGGPEHGFGICVASDGRSPPPLLAVERDEDLRKFMITWPDIETLPTLAQVIVSIGCSTGMTTIGAGGVRYGLEQTAFAAGARALISPLWDVDQSASHRWLEQFYSARRQESLSLPQACRAASLQLQREGLHAYFWAPFVVNGALGG